jgi:hypothetical protein
MLALAARIEGVATRPRRREALRGPRGLKAVN